MSRRATATQARALALRRKHRPCGRYSTFVKFVRILILVLLTVLLPVRGAVAAAMLCPGEASTMGTAATAGHGEHDMHADHDMEVQHSATHDHSHWAASDESPLGGHATA
jgi:hypothetical protein